MAALDQPFTIGQLVTVHEEDTGETYDGAVASVDVAAGAVTVRFSTTFMVADRDHPEGRERRNEFDKTYVFDGESFADPDEPDSGPIYIVPVPAMAEA